MSEGVAITQEHLHMKDDANILAGSFAVIISLSFYVQFKGGTEWAGKWISGSEWVPVREKKKFCALLQDLHGKSFYFDTPTKSFFGRYNWTPLGLASAPMCATVDLKAKVTQRAQCSAVDLNINTAGSRCAVVASQPESWTMLRIWIGKSNAWTDDEGSGLDKQRAVRTLSQVWFALTLPHQRRVLHVRRGRGHGKQLGATIHSDTFKQARCDDGEGSSSWIQWAASSIKLMHFMHGTKAFCDAVKSQEDNSRMPKNGFSFLHSVTSCGFPVRKLRV